MLDTLPKQPELSQAPWLNWRPFQKKYTEEGLTLYSEGKIVDPGAVTATGKPLYQQRQVLDASEPRTLTTVTDKPMSPLEKLQWKNFQLHKAMDKIERRDHVQSSMMKFSAFDAGATVHWLGTPFPVIEPNPSPSSLLGATRWYEHAMSAAAGIMYFQWQHSTPATKFTAAPITVSGLLFFPLILTGVWMKRGQQRLQGLVPNEPECYKFGVTETPERLAVKAERWRKYSNYKEEWMRRWNYYMWGQRPGEDFSIFHSACYFPHSQVRYNTKTDYPVRRNPYMVTTNGMRNMMLATGEGTYTKGAQSYMTAARPETQHQWSGGVG